MYHFPQPKQRPNKSKTFHNYLTFKRLTIKSFILIYLITNSLIALPCTLGIAIGDATSDGRPMLWKTRDFKEKLNSIYFTETDQFNFISNITPEYGFDKSWYGLNDQGFAIANTYISDFPKGNSGLGNGEIMNLALKTCSTIDDFKNLLNSTNKTGRKTRAIFGVIDQKGGAAIFEVGKDSYAMYDANDKSVAPTGYIIRSNFAKSIGGNFGKKRFDRSSELVENFRRTNTLNVKSILQGQMRDLNHLVEIADDREHISCLNNICGPNSISATVIQGVKKGEPAQLTTMWTMLGNPYASIAVPYWPVGNPPKVCSSDSTSALYDSSVKLKSFVFNPKNRHEINVKRTVELKTKLFKIEDTILENANKSLSKWRTSGIDVKEMLAMESQLANTAYAEINYLHSECIGKPSSRIITINEFPDGGLLNGNRKISISLPPDYQSGNKKYRVIYFFDGEKAFPIGWDNPDWFSINCYHDSLYHKGLTHPAICVAIHNNGRRTTDLTPSRGGKLEDVYQFIVEELKPYIDKNYRTFKEREYTGIAGNSLGGLASAWLACMHPETFGMAGVMSPSLWFDENLLVKKVESEQFKKLDTRFWIMSSDIQYPNMRENALRFAKILSKKGWKEGDDLAFHQVYDANHGTRGCNKQMQDMLYFLLRKEKPVLEKVEINNLKFEGKRPIDIESLGDFSCVFLNLVHTNNYRANAIFPTYHFKDNDIAAIADDISWRLLPKKNGNTFLTMDYQGFSDSIEIQSFNFNAYKKESIQKTNAAINVDGDLSEWKNLEYAISNNKTSANNQLKFDVAYDDSYAYLSIQVLDDTIVSMPSDIRSPQDHVIVYFDARPDPERMLGRGCRPAIAFKKIRIFPVTKGEETILQRSRDTNSELPEGLKVASLITKDGYQIEMAVPVEFMNNEQGSEWSGFRLNINQFDFDSKENKNSIWWQPNWSDEKNYNGSGTFKKM